MWRLLFVTALVGLTGSLPAAKARPAVYRIDPAQSRVTVTLGQEGLMSKRYPVHLVAVRQFSGAVEVPADESRLRATFEAIGESFVNIDEKMSEFERREFHRVLRDPVLDVAKFPTIAFASSGVSGLRREGERRRFTLAGELRLHGVARPVSFPVEARLGRGTLTAEGEATLKQTDYNITPYSGGLGMIRITDEVRVSFQLVAKAESK